MRCIFDGSFCPECEVCHDPFFEWHHGLSDDNTDEDSDDVDTNEDSQS